MARLVLQRDRKFLPTNLQNVTLDLGDLYLLPIIIECTGLDRTESTEH